MRVCIIDDDEANAYFFTHAMRLDYPQHAFDNYIETKSDEGYDAFIIDYRQEPENGDVIALRLKAKYPDASIVIFSNSEVEVLRQWLPDELRKFAVYKHPVSTAGERIMAIIEEQAKS